MPNANLSLQVLPMVPENKVYEVVDAVIAYIQQQGISFEVGPMETTMEGDLEQLLQIVLEAQKICSAAGADRIVSVVKIDYKPEGVTIDEKITKYR